MLIARNGNFEINTPKLALVITQYIDAYNKSHSGGLSAGPIRKNLGCGTCGQELKDGNVQKVGYVSRVRSFGCFNQT